jgi:TetR/AcrR family transcriptional repressor of nem operon
LVETAGELFWRQGYAQTGVSSIMKRAGATSGSFYHFFPTKDDLLLAVLDAAAELISTEVLAAAETGRSDPLDRVSMVIDAYRARTAANAPGYGIPVGTLVGELGPDHEAALRRVEKIYAMLVSRIAGWFADGDRRWNATVDPRRLAEFVVAALEGASMMAGAGGKTAPFDACAAQLQLHLDSLATGRSSGAAEMPPPAPAAAGAGGWKAW